MLLTIILVIHLIIAATMVGLILMQRAEGGALGIGGGGGMMSGRTPANPLTRMTAILAAIFMISSLVLALMSKRESRDLSPILDDRPFVPAPTAPVRPGTGETLPLPPDTTAPPSNDAALPPVPAPPPGDDDVDSWTPGSTADDPPAPAPYADDPLFENLTPGEDAPAQ